MQEVPPEILSIIFQFFISPYSDSEPYPYSSLRLGAICGRWRALAWSTPCLWNSISIDFDRGSLVDKLRLAREWLSRSGELPLSITITAGSSRDPSLLDVTLLCALIDAINGYAYRWRVLDISLPPPMLPLFHADPHGISILHTLTIDPTTYLRASLDPVQDSERFNPTNPCPSPMVVKIFNIHLQSVGICWDKVTHLDVDHFSVDECFEVLRHAPSLTNCHFDSIMANEFNFPIPGSTLYHPNLTSLKVKFSGAEAFFQHVTFPSLLFLSVESRPFQVPPQGLLAFLRRSSPPLHELHLLSFENEDEESIIRILSEIPSLKILHLRSIPSHGYGYDPSRVFKCLSDPSFTLSDDGTKFLPRLETMSYIGVPNFSWDLVPKIFSPIWRPLSKFSILLYKVFEKDLGDACIDETTLLQIQELPKQGISIEIKDASFGVDLLHFSRKWLSSPDGLTLVQFLLENSPGSDYSHQPADDTIH